ncbi:hypothetical protein CTheo_371 [Ceratobasidium theobromae]|uniref:Uncharacterized protein n=1 Tax=Ceratobasidium theobromae TaxID=1582974 RepID=A0A5N5QWV7_9AGAM|nr:hypothetical protein CTheo_371 [Ceratobasidium theobromae]
MIISITPRLQTESVGHGCLARLGESLFLIEMQGRLEVEGPRQGGFVGTLTMDDTVSSVFSVERLVLDLESGKGDLADWGAPPRRQNSLASKTARDSL